MKNVVLFLLIILIIILIDIYIFFCTNKTSDEIFNASLYESTFINVKSNNNIDYKTRVASGFDIMRDKNIVICMLGRNIEREIPILKNRVKYTCNCFKNYKILIFENNSTDQTRYHLTRWRNSDQNVRILGNDDGDETKMPSLYTFGACSEKRINLMANYRNKYLAILKTDYKNYDVCVVMDSDIRGGWSLDGIAHSFSFYNQWDMICSNGLITVPGTLGCVRTNYDMMAWVDSSESWGIRQEWTAFDYTRLFLKNIKISNALNTNKPLISVKSGFSALALYKVKSLLPENVWYTSKNNSCEHVGLHEAMHRAGFSKTFFNPYQVILPGKQGPSGLEFFFKNRT